MLFVPRRRWNLKWDEYATPIPPDWLSLGMVFQRRKICRFTGNFHLVKLLIVAPFPPHSSLASHNRKRTGTAFRLMASPLAAMSSNSNLSKDFYSHFPPSLLRTDCRCLSFQAESGI
ncbi:hypothetical protein CDAR_54341 [Caerostris darwini]|uniref:Uncharacterized protein n=1 Tax=Caerostris darwini TaxID=1538125 RepID=A0AAV4PNE1_9ARAC|nr:hypothetical protein CDAR_54341 [Caerostris darwini]